MFYILYAFIWLIAWLPLSVLYVFSNFFYLITYYLVGYRRGVVRTNLENSFPKKTKKEILIIEKRFYRHLCDLFVETVSLTHMSGKEIQRRVSYKNYESILEQYEKGKSVMMMTAHYGNWEWPCGLAQDWPENDSLYGVYKRQTNEHFDKMMFKLRSKFGGKPIEKKTLLRSIIKFKSEGKLGNFWMISDQTPSKGFHYWTKFLNQDTPVLTGTEELARKFDYPVFYVEILKIKRGYYHCEFIPISLEPVQTSKFEITEKYMQLLEKTIVAKPEFWLWSHRRWKYAHKIT